MKKLYFGGSILTMEKEASAEALLTEDGRIRMTGSKEALMAAARDAELVNLDGAALLPAFIDPHSHFSQVASGLLQVSLDGAVSYAEIKKRISAFVERSGCPKGGWLMARDYDHNLLEGHRNLTLDQLDDLAPEYAVAIQHKSGHMGLFNSLALTFLGVTVDTPAPEGGRIGLEDGRLTGYMEENAYFTYMRKIPMPSMAELGKAYCRAQELYASYGIATLQEGMLVEQMLPLYDMLLREKILKLDLVAYPERACFEKAYQTFPESAGHYSDHIRLGGLKIFLDGSPQGRTAWVRTPYLGGAPDDCGYGTMKDEEVREAFVLAARKGVQPLAHCNGDAAAAQMIRCLAEEEKKYPALKDLKPVMIHAQLLGIDQIPEAVQLGIIASFFVAHVWHWGDVHIRNLGLERASRISPAASALKLGLPFTFHQDAPVIAPDMLETIWCAVNRRTRGGVLLGAEERIPVMEALKAVTINAAYQYSEENEKGSLRAGKQADMVILDKNPLEAAPDELRNIKVLRTIKAGETVYQD